MSSIGGEPVQEQQNDTQRTEPEVICVNETEKRSLIGAFSDLYFDPLRFFSATVAQGYKPLLFLVIWVVGAADLMERIDRQMIRYGFNPNQPPPQLYAYLFNSWSLYWGCALVIGAISGAIIYYMGSWWYNKRLKMCGSTEHEEDSAQQVYIYTSFIFCFPTVIYSLLQTALFPSYIVASTTKSLLSNMALIFLIFPFWAVVNSYRTVVEFFAIERKMARRWFLILPIVFYIFVYLIAPIIMAILARVWGS